MAPVEADGSGNRMMVLGNELPDLAVNIASSDGLGDRSHVSSGSCGNGLHYARGGEIS